MASSVFNTGIIKAEIFNVMLSVLKINYLTLNFQIKFRRTPLKFVLLKFFVGVKYESKD